MRRIDIENYILNAYGCKPEYPWFKLPHYAVYRHPDNRKWFAVVMDLTKRKFGFDDDTEVDVMNLKCDPVLIGSLISQQGIYPGYHMNKWHWISIILDGSVDENQIKWLVDLSFDLTKKR